MVLEHAVDGRASRRGLYLVFGAVCAAIPPEDSRCLSAQIKRHPRLLLVQGCWVGVVFAFREGGYLYTELALQQPPRVKWARPDELQFDGLVEGTSHGNGRHGLKGKRSPERAALFPWPGIFTALWYVQKQGRTARGAAVEALGLGTQEHVKVLQKGQLNRRARLCCDAKLVGGGRHASARRKQQCG